MALAVMKQSTVKTGTRASIGFVAVYFADSNFQSKKRSDSQREYSTKL
jgi:hypothetical protein